MEFNVLDSEYVVEHKTNEGVVLLKDVNGDEITVKLDSICDASTYLADNINAQDDVSATDINNTVVILDSENNQITDIDLVEKIKNKKVSGLKVTFEATHDGLNLNYASYVSDSMARDTNTWIYPFAKPLIKNHMSYSEPIGRVSDARFCKSEIVKDRDCIEVSYNVTDEDAMLKFADGRYRTMSVGASSKHIKCNICGRDIVKDGKFNFCGHYKGNIYDGKVSTWTYQQLTYNEGSVVNKPADVYAQVKKIEVLNRPSNSTKDSKEDDSVSLIDDVLDPKTNVTNPTDNNKEEKPVNDDKPTSDSQDSKPDKVEDKDSVISTLKKEIEDLKNKVSVYKNEINDNKKEYETQINDIKEKLSRACDCAEQAQDKMYEMAKLNRQIISDDYKFFYKDATEDEVKELSCTEMSQKIQDAKRLLNGNVQDSSNDNNPSGVTPVKNIGYGSFVNDNYSINDDLKKPSKDDTEVKDGKKKTLNYNDIVKSLI